MELLLERFRKFIETNSLCSRDDRILLAVSGGIDSVVMLNLIREAGYNADVSHCNFHLRGEESDEDAVFVESLSGEKGLKFYRKDFNTGEFASQQGISIQMAARDLRYAWFEEIREANGYELIATAHNLDDVLCAHRKSLPSHLIAPFYCPSISQKTALPPSWLPIS